MRIVALDMEANDFPGAEWGLFGEIGDFKRYAHSSPAEAVHRCQDCQVVLANKFLLTPDLLAELPSLQYIGVTATGTNNVDLEYCRSRGIAVTNVPGYSRDSVAQLVFAYLLHHFNRVEAFDAFVKQDGWASAPSFCAPIFPTHELAGRTLAVVGYGDIGRRVAEIARCFGMRVLLCAVPGRTYTDDRISCEDAFRSADVLSLHCPLTPQTARMVNEQSLKGCRSGLVLINTARGGLVDEQAVRVALDAGSLAAFYTDVSEREPPLPGNSLLLDRRVVATPHIAWTSIEARTRLIREVYENCKAFARGELRNRIV